MDKKNKRFGLIIPNKTENISVKHAFEESESDDEPNTSGSSWLELSLNAKKKQTRIDIARAIKDDPTVYQYDEIYDDMKKKKVEVENMKKPVDRKPRYIQLLMAQANKRKQENERRIERQIQKERDQEGDEFADKESFVTPSYMKKLQEIKLFEEEELKLEMLEEIADVSKQKDMNGFYRHLYRTMTSEQPAPDKEIVLKKFSNEKNNDLVYNNSSRGNVDFGNNDSGFSISDDIDNDERAVAKGKHKFISDKEEFKIMKKNDARKYRAYKREQSPCEQNYYENKSKNCKVPISDDKTTDEKKSSSGKKKTKFEKSTNIDSDTSSSSDSSLSENENNASSTTKFENERSDQKCIKENVDKTDQEETHIKPTTIKEEKVDIWAKRTVGAVFNEALERYLLRKTSRIPKSN